MIQSGLIATANPGIPAYNVTAGPNTTSGHHQ